jgi:hypothetical protein
MRSEHRYILGHDALEIERLQLQSAVISSVTRRLIDQSGIRPGMQVLDIGCGVGDVSTLLADAVGETVTESPLWRLFAMTYRDARSKFSIASSIGSSTGLALMVLASSAQQARRGIAAISPYLRGSSFAMIHLPVRIMRS